MKLAPFMIDDKITLIQGKLMENLSTQVKLLEMGSNFAFLQTRQVELENELEELRKQKVEAA